MHNHVSSPPPRPATVSLICTVRDEADSIVALLESMCAQSRLPDEIIINDCQSRDSTPALVQQYSAREPRVRLVAGGHNISSGRNNAIAAAMGDIIACTDAGLTLAPDWLAHIVAPLEQDRADMVGGFFCPAPQTLFETALGATNYRHPEEIDATTFMPFGKSMAFRKTVWEHVGGFPERLSHCEDLVFDIAVEKAGYRRAFAPDALVHFRPRDSLWAFARQYFWYARGDGIADLWAKRHLIRYGSYAALLTLLHFWWHTPATRPLLTPLIAAGVVVYTRAPYRRLWPQIQTLPWPQRLGALALVPLIRVVGDVAKMAGYPVGLAKRKRVR